MNEESHKPPVTIESARQLVESMEAGAKPRSEWRIGTEHEKFGVDSQGRPIPYAGDAGIERVLTSLAEQYSWQPQRERGRIIALRRGLASITLEPGGQLELAGEAFPSLARTCPEIGEHLDELRAVSEPLGIRWLGVGFHPLARRDDFTWMPKERYQIMRRYMSRRGSRGLDMMVRTCTVQANVDYGDEADAATKLRLAFGIAPIVTAMFASSPFVEGRDSGFQSYRAWCWLDTDPDRTGLIPAVFEPGFGFEQYVAWALDVPMYLIERNGEIVDMTGTTFRQFLANGAGGNRATLDDWHVHLTTLFPEARLKTYIEVRSADAGSHGMNCALPAFWKGLLYDDDAMNEAWELVSGWSFADRQSLAAEVARVGLRARAPAPSSGSVLDLARALTRVSRGGLERQHVSAGGRDETGWLTPLAVHLAKGTSPADRLLARWSSELEGDPQKLVDALVY